MTKVINRLLADNKGRGLFRVENDANEATIYIYDVIVLDAEWGGVSAIDFARALAAIGPTAIVHLRINSPGGEVFAAQAMASAIKERTGKTVAHVDGLAASSASWLAIAADEVVISDGGMMMIHQAMTIAAGDAEDLRATAALLEKIDGILVDAYAKATGQTPEQIAAWMAAETWFTAQEAVDAGFAGRIAESAPRNLKSWNLSAYAHPPAAAAPENYEDSDAPTDPPAPSPTNTEHMLRCLRLAELQSD